MAELLIGGFDIETSGRLTPKHAIIEACLMRYRYDTDSGLVTPVSNDTWRIKPRKGVRIEKEAFAVHGISSDDLVGSPEFKDIAPIMVPLMDECDIVVAHNGNEFDFPFLIQELDLIKHDIPDFEPFDTMLSGRAATPWGKVPNLGELCFALDVDYDAKAAHAADYDVDCMMKCFFRGLELGFFQLPE